MLFGFDYDFNWHLSLLMELVSLHKIYHCIMIILYNTYIIS